RWVFLRVFRHSGLECQRTFRTAVELLVIANGAQIVAYLEALIAAKVYVNDVAKSQVVVEFLTHHDASGWLAVWLGKHVETGRFPEEWALFLYEGNRDIAGHDLATGHLCICHTDFGTYCTYFNATNLRIRLPSSVYQRTLAGERFILIWIS